MEQQNNKTKRIHYLLFDMGERVHFNIYFELLTAHFTYFEFPFLSLMLLVFVSVGQLDCMAVDIPVVLNPEDITVADFSQLATFAVVVVG